MRLHWPTLALVALAPSAWAQQPPAPGAAARAALFQGLPPLLQQSVGPGMSRETFVDRVRKMFAYLDADADGTLDASDALAYEGGRQAKLRAAIVAAMTAFDVDGDGRVSEAEMALGLRRGLKPPPGQEAMDTHEATAKGILWALDANKDGFIDYAEMRAAPLPPGPGNPVEALLALAPQGRESLGAEEAVATAALVVFDLLDADRDGFVDAAEYATAVPPRAGG